MSKEKDIMENFSDEAAEICYKNLKDLLMMYMQETGLLPSQISLVVEPIPTGVRFYFEPKKKRRVEIG